MYYDFHIMKGIEKLKNLKKLVLSINPIFHKVPVCHFPYLEKLQYLKVSSIHWKTLQSIVLNIPNTIKILYFQYILNKSNSINELFESRMKEWNELQLLK